MGWLTWIIFGALAGWIASVLMGRSNRMGCLSNVFIGVLGAFVGGWIGSALFGVSITGFNISGLGIAVLGAAGLLGITGWYQSGRKKRK